MTHRFSPLDVVRVLTLAMVLMLVAIAPATVAQKAGTPVADMTAVEVVEQVQGAVVTVINEQTVTSQGGDESLQPVGAGTGFIIDGDGHIVTNWHVVTEGTTFSVILSDGTEVEAELVGEDPRDDLAVVKIDEGDVPDTVALGDSNQVKVGETVLAIGSPLGAFQNSVTQGIVGSLNRDEFSAGGLCLAYADLIQHDAAINPGNSGGPLFNLRGEVIGVNTLGLTTTQSGQSVQGLSFAIPSNTVSMVVDQLIDEGYISAPYLGISFATLNPELSAVNDLPVDYGVYVQEVEEDGPAAEAGVEADDIIISVGDEELSAETSLSSILFTHVPGDTLDVKLLRGEEETTVTVTLGEAPESLFEQCSLEGPPATP